MSRRLTAFGGAKGRLNQLTTFYSVLKLNLAGFGIALGSLLTAEQIGDIFCLDMGYLRLPSFHNDLVGRRQLHGRDLFIQIRL